jgi:hypothetical protein
MAKKVVAPTTIPKVSCSGCKHKVPSEHLALMYCDKIKMPMPSHQLNHCIYKSIK